MVLSTFQFKYSYDSTDYWAPSRVKGLDPPEYAYDDSTEASNVKPEDVLNYPHDQDELDVGGYYEMETATLTTLDSTHPSSVVGIWNGFLYDRYSDMPFTGISMDLKPSTPDGNTQPFTASGRYNDTEYTLVGQCTEGTSPGLFDVTIKQSYPVRFVPKYYHGQFEPASGSLIGTWGYDEDHSANTWSFVFKRIPALYMGFRPVPTVFEGNKPRALWSFAISAVLYDVRKRNWSKSFFNQRRESKNRFIELQIRNEHFGRNLDTVEAVELRTLRGRFNAADNRFFHSLAAYKARRIIDHK